MAKLTPKIELIKAKYRGRTDAPTKQKMQQEIMALQQKEGYSPFSGCLPLLLQFPIIIFLYNVIRNPLTYICKLSSEAITKINEVYKVDLSSAGEIGLASKIDPSAFPEYADQLSSLPDFKLFGIDLGGVPKVDGYWLIIIPFVAAALTWLSMFLTRRWNGHSNPAEQMQDAQSKTSLRIMDLLMPAMTLGFAFTFSGMMGVYWIYQSALGILQSYTLSKAMPLPKYTEEELKAMKKAQKEAEKAQRSALKEAPKFRSLHYIDEDDYDALPEVKTDNSKKKDNSGSMDAPEIKD